MLRSITAASILAAAAIGIAAGFAPKAAPAPAPAPAAAPTVADAFKVDPVHSAAIYRIKHNGVSYHYGRFDTIEGTFILDKDNPSSSSISLTIPTESINSNNPKRDGHLKTPDFFSVKEFPSITFKSTEVTKKGESNGEQVFEVKGDLTLHGQTKPITAEVRQTGEAKGQKGELAGLETTLTIKRSDFGMNFMVGKGLGDDVTITVALEGGR